jgi:hypothetical protein
MVQASNDLDVVFFVKDAISCSWNIGLQRLQPSSYRHSQQCHLKKAQLVTRSTGLSPQGTAYKPHTYCYAVFKADRH